MRKFILLLFLIGFYTVSYCQLIKGTIVDAKTKSTIYSASVYFDGTFVGTNSDLNGYFELDASKNSSMPLTISAIGYYSTRLVNYSSGKPLIIQLTPKVYELKEAVVKTKSLRWKRYRNLKLFKEEFLGTTANAFGCEITNENDITFNYDSDKDTLKAFALKPILIKNKALGYSVTYYLDKFEYYKKKRATFFSGNIIFTEYITTEKTLKSCYERRKQTYLGSRMHFIRALWVNDLKANKFTIEDLEYKILNYGDIVSLDDGNRKFIKYPRNLIIERGKATSYIFFLKEYVYFDKTGYFDPAGINWKGDMVDQRIADWLPYEYSTE